jgi:hypothetical protein
VGIATKYVKQKGACGGGGGGQPGTYKLIPLEADFFDRLKPEIFISGSIDSIPPKLLTCLEKLPDAFLHDTFTYLYSNESFIGDKRSLHQDLVPTAFSRTTIQVRITIRTCVSNQNTAFVAFNYNWEYVTSGKDHFREDGICVQTWVGASDDWLLLGEYFDAVEVEPVAKIQ